eukprot:413461_1
MILWSIIKSPLIFGGVAMKLSNDSFTLDLLTNKYCLDVNSYSYNNRQIYAIYDVDNGLYPSQAIWTANGNRSDYYVAFFNLFDMTGKLNRIMNVTFNELNISSDINQCLFQSAFNKTDNGLTNNRMVQVVVPINDTVLYYLNECR